MRRYVTILTSLILAFSPLAKLLEFNYKGKLIKTIHLTEKGSKVAEHMEKIKDLL